jgi:hypothetical protein
LFGKLEVYIDHTNIDFTKYLAIADPGTPTSKYRATDKKRYCNEFSEEEMVHWAEHEAEVDIGIATASDKGNGKASIRDKGKARVSDTGVSDLAVATTNASASASDFVDSDYVDNGMIPESDNDDSDYSVKLELIEHRTRKASRVKTRATPIPDMAANPSTNIPRGGDRSEVFIEHDEFIDELLRKMNDVDFDRNLQDPFLGVQATQDRYPTHD